MACVLSYMLGSGVSVMTGITVAFWVWLGFIATVMFGSFLWERKPFRLYVINVTFQLVIILVIGIIIASLQ